MVAVPHAGTGEHGKLSSFNNGNGSNVSIHEAQTPILTETRLPLPPWSSSRSGLALPDLHTIHQTSIEHVQVPLLHFKQDALNFIKENLGSDSRASGDSVMAMISCLLFLEAASWETNPDALPSVVMHLNGLVTAANHYCGPVVNGELTIVQKFLGMAVSCVTNNDAQEQLCSTPSIANQYPLRGVLFIGLSSKPTDAGWWVYENKSANANCGPASLSRRLHGQRQYHGFTSARMIAYLYLCLVLRPGRMSNEILECLTESIGTGKEDLERRAMDDPAEQAALFWSMMLSRAAMASMRALPGRGPETLYWKQRLIDRDIRSASAMLQLQTWPEAVTLLKRVAFVEFEGERELQHIWEKALSGMD